MTDTLHSLDEALAALHAVWAADSSAAVSVESLGRPGLVAVNEALGALRRRLDAVHVQVAAEIARESRPELGNEGLAKQHGYRNATALIAATTGTSTGDAARLVAVGQATAPRMTLTGESAPAKHPFVADALDAGRIGMLASHAIITMLDRVAFHADRDALDEAERMLADAAPGLTLDQLMKVIARAEAYLNPDGVVPNERDARGDRGFTMVERNGRFHLNGVLDIVGGAPVKAAIDALVTAQFRRDDPAGPDAERRTVRQLQADGLIMLARHALGCDHSDLPLDDTTVVVRVNVNDLQDGSGTATIDGIGQPVSISAVRRMAAGGGIIPCVLGADSEILDWGREKRLFTKAQKLALVERDGGCAMCGLAPGMTKAHHLKWWLTDSGPTDLANGVLLCESCHHRIHDNGWDIRIDGKGTRAKVWFLPPPHIDPHRTPRLGGKARYDYHAA